MTYNIINKKVSYLNKEGVTKMVGQISNSKIAAVVADIISEFRADCEARANDFIAQVEWCMENGIELTIELVALNIYQMCQDTQF
jgi:ADP-dependent phosphofructokinase/glucokinase